MINLEHFLKDISIIRTIGIFQCICGLLAMISEIMEISVTSMEKSCWIYGRGIWILSSAIFILSGGLVLTSAKYYNNNYHCCLGWNELYFSVLVYIIREKYFSKYYFFLHHVEKPEINKYFVRILFLHWSRKIKFYVKS